MHLFDAEAGVQPPFWKKKTVASHINDKTCITQT
jgi:hypothetical protein